MKKLIYLCLIAFSVSIIHAETQYVEKSFQIGVNPVTGSYEAVTVLPSSTQLSNLPLRESENSSQTIPSFFFYDPLENEFFGFSTRIHPFPEDPDAQDTARTITSKLDPQSQMNIGDTQIPINVVDQFENTIFKLNGFHQVLPSMQYFIPGFQSGTVTLDSVVFWLYTTPGRPMNNWLYFLIVPLPENIPNLGTDQFNPGTFNLPYSTTIEEKIVDIHPMDAYSVNSKTIDNGDGTFRIQPTSVNLSDYPSMRNFDIHTPLDLLIIKDSPGDLRDTVSLIGAWEWGLSYSHAFAGVVKHYPDNNDSISLLSQFRLIPQDPVQYRKEWPGIDTNLRRNYRFIVYGRFTGEYSSVNKTEEFSNLFSLEQNIPNPVSSTTKISFSTNITSYTTLKVYNQLGELVATLVNETLTPGVYNTDFDASNLPPGLYFYTFSSGNQTKTLPMIITR